MRSYFSKKTGQGTIFTQSTKKEGNAKIVSNTVVKMWELYGQETLKYIAALPEWKSKVTIYIIHVLHFRWSNCYANYCEWSPTQSQAISIRAKSNFCFHNVGLQK